MLNLTPQGQAIIDGLVKRYGVSEDAVMTLLQALSKGNGTMAQFDHPELGGAGQWLKGGMTMVGNMFDNVLKAKVDGICSELSQLLEKELRVTSQHPGQFQSQSQGQPGGYGEVSLFVASSGHFANWWPPELGTPAATGAQNDIRYAYFPRARRLAVELNGETTVYDTGDHQISGVSQQQSTGASLTFVSQHGLVRLSELPVVSTSSATQGTRPPAPRDTARASPVPEVSGAAYGTGASDDVFAKIERLAELRQKGILSEEEFAAKKAELLDRL